MKNDHRIPEICPTRDPSSASLSSAEGFLLSRIDGKTSYGLLCEIGAMQPEQVRACLDKWHAAGLIRFADEAASGARQPTQHTADHRSLDEYELPDDLLAAIDSSLDIPEKVQRSVLVFQAYRANGTDYEVLGLPEQTDANAVKRAYFALSRQFHPDRYYGKNIGLFEDRLGAVFQKISDAYHGLSSSLPKMAMTESAGVSESVEAPSLDVKAKAEEESRIEAEKRARGEKARAARRKARREAMERARKRRPFNPYRTRAEALLEEAERQLEQKAWKDAAGTLRLAKSFVQGDRVLKRRMKELRGKLDQRRA